MRRAVLAIGISIVLVLSMGAKGCGGNTNVPHHRSQSPARTYSCRAVLSGSGGVTTYTLNIGSSSSVHQVNVLTRPVFNFHCRSNQTVSIVAKTGRSRLGTTRSLACLLQVIGKQIIQDRDVGASPKVTCEINLRLL